MLVWPFNVFAQNFGTISFFSGSIIYIFFDKLPGNLIKMNATRLANNDTILTDLRNLDNALKANPIDSLPEASQVISNMILSLTSISSDTIDSLKAAIQPVNAFPPVQSTLQILLSDLNSTNVDKNATIGHLNNVVPVLQRYQVFNQPINLINSASETLNSMVNPAIISSFKTIIQEIHDILTDIRNNKINWFNEFLDSMSIAVGEGTLRNSINSLKSNYGSSDYSKIHLENFNKILVDFDQLANDTKNSISVILNSINGSVEINKNVLTIGPNASLDDYDSRWTIRDCLLEHVTYYYSHDRRSHSIACPMFFIPLGSIWNTDRNGQWPFNLFTNNPEFLYDKSYSIFANSNDRNEFINQLKIVDENTSARHDVIYWDTYWNPKMRMNMASVALDTFSAIPNRLISKIISMGDKYIKDIYYEYAQHIRDNSPNPINKKYWNNYTDEVVKLFATDSIIGYYAELLDINRIKNIGLNDDNRSIALARNLMKKYEIDSYLTELKNRCDSYLDFSSIMKSNVRVMLDTQYAPDIFILSTSHSELDTLNSNINAANPNKTTIINNLNSLNTRLTQYDLFNTQKNAIRDTLAKLNDTASNNSAINATAISSLTAIRNYFAQHPVPDIQSLAQTLLSNLNASTPNKKTLVGDLENLRAGLQFYSPQFDGAINSINVALTTFNNTSTLSPGNLTKLQNLLPQIIFYGNSALSAPAHQLYSDLFTNVSSNVFLNILIPQLFSIFLVLVLNIIPVLRYTIQGFRVYDFNQAFSILWYDGILGSIMVFVFCILALNILSFVKYLINALNNAFNISAFTNSFQLISYLIQILVSFGLSKLAENLSCGWSPKDLMYFYFYNSF